MKSLEGVDIAWVEEAHLVSEDSWQLLIPTIRKEGSEIWITFNPNEEDDPTYKRFVVRPPPLTEDRKNVTDDFISDDAIVIKVGWQDNLWFPQTLENERLYLLAIDPEAYAHVWDGECRTITDAVIFKGRYQVGCFDPPEVVQFHFGLDFGYADDPMACTRMWVTEHRGIAVGEGKDRKLIETGDGPIRWQELWIDYEAYGHRVEIDAYPDLLDQIPGSRQWPILADSSRPESISYIARKGFRCSAAEKWQGSVEDGIAHLKAFRVIHIHQRCIHHLFEARAYKWKVDKITNDILPIIVDKHNHCWDADRYALSKYIQRRGVLAQWAKLGQ
jgi:phage terminase large subunit